MIEIDEQSILTQWSWELPKAKKVLVFAPHPDDEVFGCAGTLLKLQDAGAEIRICIVTDGSGGGDSGEENLVEVRAQESRRAAELLGFAEPKFLNFIDRSLSRDERLLAACLRSLEEVQPDLVFVTAPTEPNPDHYALACAVGQATRQYAEPLKILFYEVGYPLTRPNLMQNISAYQGKKYQAMQCFVSQIRQQPYHTQISSLNHYRSYLAPSGATSVEAFVITDSGDLIDGLPDLFHWPLLSRRLNAEMLREQELARTAADELKKSSVELEQLKVERQQQAAENEQRLAELDQKLARQKQRLAEHSQELAERDQQLAERDQRLTERDQQFEALSQQISEIYASRSWRITAPIRNLTVFLRRSCRFLRNSHQIVKSQGGMLLAVRKTVRVMRREGITGIRNRFAREHQQLHHATAPPVVTETEISKLKIVPYYLNPQGDGMGSDCPEDISIAIHLHLYYPELLPEFVSRLNQMPCRYDLYVSVREGTAIAELKNLLQRELPNVVQVVIESVPNRGRDIAPLIIQFGDRLARYQIIAHFHSKKSPHSDRLDDWLGNILDLLLGRPNQGGETIAQIINLLQTKAKLVYPEGNTQIIKDSSGWGANYDLAKRILEQSNLTIEDFPIVEFSEGSMFWARGACLREYLSLPLSWSDFPAEPIPPDGTLAHALERLPLIFANSSQGDFYRLHRGDSIHDYRGYEEQQDYSSRTGDDVKVLAYYLPQFHPIPENDLWHGQGFTEWTKVRAANPLFAGHYQQHIPHPDIGYYLLDTPEVFRKQAELMRKAGVFGQVFYHYWFSGKLILEKPAQLLLNTPDIAMPFCFCWANENWTRRWDGNSDAVLLRQDYSDQDARNFIHYLIPFFRDSRYIRVENRPVLFVYRPSSMPDSQQYLDIWARECAACNIERPYVVAVLTRGAGNPGDFGMDAGVERVLHDWTAGAVPEMKENLRAYQPLRGSVLDYDKVADFYSAQNRPGDFTWFRSLVPIWDNTARYGADAFLVHGSTPGRFSDWLAQALAYSRANLPPDRRFVLVNAWNEWAEGAHLEPDSRYGYAYLNAVGRTLAGIAYAAELNADQPVPSETSLRVAITEEVLTALQDDALLKQRFIACLSQSTIFHRCRVEIDPPHLLAGRTVAGPTDRMPDFILQIRRAVLFDPELIEKMLKTACRARGSVVLSNAYDRHFSPIVATENGSVETARGYEAPLLLLPIATAGNGYKNYRLRADAHSFVAYPNTKASKKLPEVTTVIRYHRSGDLDLLKNALYSLAAMQDCRVAPLIAAQDLDAEQTAAVQVLLDQVPWPEGLEPRLQAFTSPGGQGDLRSKMLNESLRNVRTRYAAFLDYDDLLMSHAYKWLLERLHHSGKAVSFGRVYSTAYDRTSGRFLERTREFTHGFSYDDFLACNHAPLHSFLLDLTQLDLEGIVYHDDQRYLEDYYLTLQLFTRDNADWDSLAENVYIGDYIHVVGGTNTLAFADDQQHSAIISSPEYTLCQQRIDRLRDSLR